MGQRVVVEAQPEEDKVKEKEKPTHWIFQKTADINRDYQLGAKIGEPGQFGYARVAERRGDKEKYCTKIVSKTRFTNRAFFASLKDEVTVMQKVGTGKHENIVRYYDLYEDEQHIYIVMELMQGGELFDRIQQKGSYSEYLAASVLRQMVSSLKFLHDQKIIHGDIKPDNFLFAHSGDSSPIKLIDFGMSKVLQPRQKLRTMAGTPAYVAPEVLTGQYDISSDMWSIGVVSFVMLYGFMPFFSADTSHKGRQRIFALIKEGFHPETRTGYGPWFPEAIKLTDSAKDFMTKLMQMNVADRLTADEAINHPWLRGETASKEVLDPLVLKGLKEFDAGCKLKQRLLLFMADTLTPADIRNIKETFVTIDANGDGHITYDELQAALAKWKDNEETHNLIKQIENIFSQVDVDHSGDISYEELLMATVQRQMNAKEERLWQAFNRLDLDGDGKITKDELKFSLQEEDDEVIRDLIKDADADGDGCIDYQEFVEMWDKKAADFQ